MKDKFQSKTFPQGTRTIWRYLSALILFFALGIGQMWAAEETITWDGTSLAGVSSTNITAGTALAVAGSDGRKVQTIEVYNSTQIASGGTTRKKYNDGWWEDFYSTPCTTSDCTDASSTARIEIPFTIGASKTFEITSVSFDFAQNGGSGPAVHAFLVQGTTEEWLGYKSATGTCNYTPTGITFESGEAKLVFVLGIGANKLGDNRGFLFSNISITGDVEDSGAGPVAVTAITIAPSSATIKVGKTVKLTPTITPSNATDKTVTWAVTSGGSYASVTDAGVVTGLAAGTAVVTATAHDGSGVTQTATITVEACPASGTIYKFQLKTDLTNGNLTTSVPQDVVMTTENYLSNLTGGTLTAAARSNVNRINISNGNAIGFANGDQAFLKMDLDCAIQEGDILKYTITSNDMILMAGSETEATNRMTLSRNVTQVEVDSKLVGADALYMKRSSSSPKISYFEVFRPVYNTITLEYADGVTPDGTIKVLDGEAATKPADPTWEHHRFAGWYNGSDPYDWSETVGGDLTLTAHWTQLYTITYAAGDGTATGDAPTQVDKAAGEKFIVAANTFAVEGKDFSTWNDGANNFDPGMEYTMGSANVTLTAQWVTASTKYAITKGSHANGDFTIDPAEQAEGQKVTLAATPAEDYLFGAWEIVKTEDASATGILVDDNGQFEMPAYAVTVNATFVADPRAKVLYVTNNTADATAANDKLYAALKDIYNVKIVDPTSDADQTAYALVVLHESVGGSSYNATAVAAAKAGNTPVLNTKSYFYNDGRWGWGTPNAGQSVKGATMNSAYCNIADHPLFDGVTVTAGFVEITDDAAAKCMQPIGSFVEGKEGYILATAPNADSGDGAAIHELTPAQRGASAGKYLMISVSNAKLNALNANGQKLFQNAAAYLIGSTSWTPIAVPTAAEITGTTAYKTGENIALTASATGTIAAATYAWYKGDTWVEAEAAGTIQAAATAAAGGNTFGVTGCAVGDAGKYWCVISNGTDCDVKVSVDVTVAQTYTVTYMSNGAAGPEYIYDYNATVVLNCPVEFIAQTGKMFYGWKDGEDNDVAVGAAVTSNLVLYAQWGDIMVAKIGETLYPSLEAALEHAADGEIVLLQDIDVTAQVEVLAGVTATLDLAGYKIEYTGTSTLASGVILVHNGASLTIDDSSDPDAGSIVSGADAYAAIALTKAGDDAANPAVLVINGGIFTGYYYGITGNGSRPNTQITINGGTITATATNDNLGIYHPQDGTLTVNGGTITAYASAIEMRAGTLVINGGTFTATASEFSCNPNGSGTTTVGAAIAIAQHTTKTDIVVTIKGGTFEGEKAINESNPQVNDPAPQVDLTVTGGDFTGEVSTVDVDHFISGGSFDAPVSNENCAEGFVPSPLNLVTGKYSVEPKDGVSIIKVATTGGTNKTVTGLYAGEGDVNLSTSTKMDNGKYIGFTLDGTTLQAGDRINVHTSQAANTAGSHIIFYDNMTAKNELYETGEIGGLGDNIFEVNAAMIGSATAYVYRANNDAAHQWNGYVDYIEVTRAMKPMLTAITIDGRDGVIDEANKTVAVTIPNESNLAALTVVPTIAWNEAAATNSIVVNDGSAWIEGANTYKLTDKDGDYTVYTITLTRDVLKHAVKFYDGETLLETVEVEDGESIDAGDVPADPTKEDYVFQGWAETADGAVVDVTSFTISATKNFYAKWAAETGVVKLIVAGAINHTNFYTGAAMSETPVTIETVDYDYAQLGSTASNPSVNALNKLIAYNATTTKTKVMLDVYNKNTSARTVKIWGVVEGSSEYEELASVALDNGDNKRVKTGYYEFNNLDGKNRTIYIGVPSSVGDVVFLQVKVVESGDPIHMFGEVGYSINFNKGRLFGPSANDLAFEGMTYNLSSGYQALSSTAISLNKNSSYRVDVASPVTMTVTTSNGSKFYVDQATDGTANETASAGEHEFNLTAGTWYINVAGSNLGVSSISFALPKAEKPVVADLDNVDYCTGETIDELTVVATVSDGGTKLYQWYKDGVKIDGAEEDSYQPTADGEYYVIVVNTLAGHQNSDPTQSNTITVTGHAGTAISGTTGAEDWPGADVTISVTASGKNLSYAWYTCDDALGANPVAVDPAVNAAELDVTVGAADSYYKVVVSGDCGEAQEAVITVVARQAIAALVDVTGNMKWDFSKANDGSAAGSNLCNDEVLANVAGIVNNSDFESDNIMATANKFSSGKLQASMIKFHTTVPGAVIVKLANTGSKTEYRYLVVNGVQSEARSKDATVVTYAEYVPAGDVVLTVTTGNGGNMFNFTSVEFKVDKEASLARTDSWLAPGELGTICIENGAVAVGADIYELVGREPQYGKVVFETVKHMKPGKPYMFIANDNRIDFITTDEAEASEPDNSGAMKGTFAELNLTELDNVYYFAGHALWSCVDLNSLHVSAHRAYVQLDEVEPLQSPNPAPGRRRVTMNVNGEQVATGIETANDQLRTNKFLINGQLFILRGEKLFDATGRLVK